MTVNEVAGLLGYSREQVVSLIKNGLKLPISGRTVKLHAAEVGGPPDVSDAQFDEFVAQFDAEEPGRWPPAEVRRELLVEARHACAICGSLAPLQFHHMLDWAKVRHHDARHMLAVCGTCHSRCTNGLIDYKSQSQYKAMVRAGSSPTAAPHREKKHDSDLRTLKGLFSLFPRPLVDKLLDEASWDRIHTDHIDVLDAAEGIVYSTVFHLYDTELTQLLKDFFFHWNSAWEVGLLSHRVFHHRGLATLSLIDTDSSERWDDHKKYQEHVAQARRAHASLNSRLRERFPDFDIEESDKEASRNYWELVERVKKEAEERWGKFKGDSATTEETEDVADEQATSEKADTDGK